MTPKILDVIICPIRETLEEVECFTCLVNVITELGGPDAHVNIKIGKARIVILQLKNVCI